MCEDGVAEAVLSGFVKPGETLELDAPTGKNEGLVQLKNGRGKTKLHTPSAAAGIEDDAGAGGDASPVVADPRAKIDTMVNNLK